MKKIQLKVNREKHIQHVVTIWSGYYKLTELEKKMTCYIVNHYVELSEKISDVELFNKNFMDSEFKKNLMDHFTIKPPQLTNYVKSLINKKVIREEEGTYYMEGKFIPSNKLVFEFKYE
jgi:hypothetical protein